MQTLRALLGAIRTARAPAASFAALGLLWGTWAAFVPQVKARLGVDDGTFGLLLLASALGLVSAMWVAPRVDRALGERAMQVLALLFALAWIGPALAPVPSLFFGALLVVGLCSGLLDVTMNARVSELEAATGRPLMNAAHGLFSVGYTLGAVLAGVEREAGWPFLGGLLVAVALLGLGLVPMMRQAPAVVAVPEGGRGPFPLLPVALCGAVVLSAFMAEAAVEAWSALHIERTLGGGAGEGALGPAMLGLTMAVGRFGGQVVAERLREVAVVVVAGLVAGAGCLLAAWAPGPGLATLGFGLFGLGVSVIGPMGLALVGRIVPPHRRTEAIARTAVIGFAGFFFAPVVMGLISQALDLRAAFTAMALLVALSVPLALALRGR